MLGASLPSATNAGVRIGLCAIPTDKIERVAVSLSNNKEILDVTILRKSDSGRLSPLYLVHSSPSVASLF